MLSYKRFLLISAFFILKIGSIFCQSIPAKITFLDGTIRKVSIDNRSFNIKNELKVNDKVIPIIPEMKIEIRDIVYEVKNVTLLDYDKLPELSTIKVHEIDTTLILKKLIGGTLNLYSFEENAGYVHWFLEKENEIFELIEIEYTKGWKIGNQERYKHILNQLLANCADIKSEIDQMSFSGKALKKVVRKFNSTCGDLGFVSSEKKRFMEFGANLGYQIHTSKLPRGTRLTNGLNDLGLGEITSRSPVLGLYFRTPLTKKIDRISVSIAAHYIHSLSFEQVDSTFSARNEPDTTISSLAFDASYFGSTGAIRYTLPFDKSKFKPFVEAGIEIRRLLKVKEDFFRFQRLKRPFYNSDGQNDLIGPENLPTPQFYYRFRTGVKKGDFELGINYFFGQGGFTGSKRETQTGFGLDFRYALF